MILTRTPLRISIAGGGTDLPAFYYNHGSGLVVSMAIDKFIHIGMNEKFDGRTRACYSTLETVNDPKHLKHELIRECLRLANCRGVEVNSVSDIPSGGTGLGSSSAYTVGLLTALNTYKRLHLTQEQIYAAACEIEILRCGNTIGKQDQAPAVYGGFRSYEFAPNDKVFIGSSERWSRFTQNNLAEKMLLVYTGVRSADGILSKQSARSIGNPATIAALKELKRIAAYTCECLDASRNTDVCRLMHESWLVKRELTPETSCLSIDEMYDTALRNGAYGGKLLGAGGSGFLLIMAERDSHRHILSALGRPKHLRVHIERTGSEVCYNSDRKVIRTPLLLE